MPHYVSYNTNAHLLVTETQLAQQASKLARVCHAGIIHLIGDLGVGKTTFCRYFIQALIADVQVTSPSYAIIHEYANTDINLYHIDLFRIEHPQEIEGLGLRSLINNHSILLIEWPEKGTVYTPKAHVTIQLSHHNQDTRKLHIQQTETTTN